MTKKWGAKEKLSSENNYPSQTSLNQKLKTSTTTHLDVFAADDGSLHRMTLSA
jgi:hypothetical protein